MLNKNSPKSRKLKNKIITAKIYNDNINEIEKKEILVEIESQETKKQKKPIYIHDKNTSA